ncbi:MAG: response regulator [Blastocatellia bacterium]|nr:response regulator [Blastocatellia bacterium]
MNQKLRVVIADDERPARSFLAALLRDFEDVVLIGEADNGMDAVELIERERPDLALLDLQMPELDGLGIVRMLKKNRMPLVAFVTAYDEYAVKAFELNAIDYLLKPVERARLRTTLHRAMERLEQSETIENEIERVRTVAAEYEAESCTLIERIPIRRRDDILLLPVAQVASIIAEGELLHITTERLETYTLSYRLKDLEAKLDPAQFVRLGRGTIANLEMMTVVSQMPGGTYNITLRNGQKLAVSRLQSRLLRERLFRL